MVAPQPFFRARGTPFSVLHRIRALLSSGHHQVHLLTYPFGEDVGMPGLEITRCARPAFINDVRIGPSAAKILLDIKLYALTARMLKQRRYDVIHSHEEAAFFCQRFADRYHIPHIYDMHSSLPQQLDNFSKFDLAPLRWLFQRLESSVLRRCDGVITICSELAEVAEPFAMGKPHAMIENTANDAAVFGMGEEQSALTQQLSGKRVILYTGTLEKYQGLDLLLDAFAEVKRRIADSHLLLVGGTPEQVDSIREQIERLDVGSAATLTGTVHPSAIPGLYRLADVIVSPRSRGTNTPLKIYSYLRSRRPIVATRLLTHTQTLSEDNACLVEPTAEDLAGGICRVLQDPVFAERLVRAATLKAETDFADEAYVGKVENFFASVMRPTDQPRGDGSDRGRVTA